MLALKLMMFGVILEFWTFLESLWRYLWVFVMRVVEREESDRVVSEAAFRPTFPKMYLNLYILVRYLKWT